jgi:hypothetical protein
VAKPAIPRRPIWLRATHDRLDEALIDPNEQFLDLKWRGEDFVVLLHTKGWPSPFQIPSPKGLRLAHPLRPEEHRACRDPQPEAADTPAGAQHSVTTTSGAHQTIGDRRRLSIVDWRLTSEMAGAKISQPMTYLDLRGTAPGGDEWTILRR